MDLHLRHTKKEKICQDRVNVERECSGLFLRMYCVLCIKRIGHYLVL